MVDVERSKLFVGGISWGIDENMLKEYFSQYGDVSSSVIARDHNSQTPRGFGFVTFSDSASADKALAEKHKIMDKVVDVKRAVPRSGPPQSQQKQRDNDRCCGCGDFDYQLKTKKIFVGGLPATVTQEEFRAYFEKFGRITDVVVMHDNSTNRPRGFGFITFESEDIVDIVVQKHYYELGGKTVEVKRAVPKDSARHLCNVYNHKNGGNGVDNGGSSSDGFWMPNQLPGGFRYGYYPVPGYYNPGYPFNGYYGAMYPMGSFGPVRYFNMAAEPMIPTRGLWNDSGMARANGSAPFSNMNVGVGVVSRAGSVSADKNVKDSEGTKRSESARGVNDGLANGPTMSGGKDQTE